MTVIEKSLAAPVLETLTDPRIGQGVEEFGRHFVRYALVLVLAWMGLMKFTGFEASAIQPMVANSPFLFWLYDIMSVRAASSLIGVIEVTAAVLLAVRPWSAKAALAGAALAVGTFVITITMIFTLPSWEATLGFPVLTVMPGQFLIKDVLFLGAAVWLSSPLTKSSLDEVGMV